jgi:glutathione S-transferase
MAPHAALAEVGVDYELVRVERNADGSNTSAYLALNPWGRIPTLEDGDLALTESAAILLHLGDRFPDAGLVPAAGTRERSELYRWLVLLTNTLQPALMRVMYPTRFGTAGVVEAASADAQIEFGRIDAHLTGREWLVGESRTAADLFLFMLTRWGRHLDPPAWDQPNLRAHWLRSLALPGVTKMIDEQGLELPSL